METAPKYRDSDNTLLFKIVQKSSNSAGGLFPPRYGDSNNRLLQKWAKLLSGGGPTPPVPGDVFGIWAASFFSPPGGGDSYAFAVAKDSAGNVIVTGQTDVGSGDNNFYTVKYAALTGTVIWAVQYAGPAGSYDVSNAVVVDSEDNVIVTGESDNASDADIFTIKYAAATGAVIWEVRKDGGGGDVSYSVAVDSNDNVVVTGETASGTANFYTAKYAAADGSVIWEVAYDGPGAGQDVAQAVAVDSQNNVVVTGFSRSAASLDFFTVKYAAADGSVIWQVRYDGTVGFSDIGQALVIDSQDNVVVTGESSNGANGDFYTAKYAAADGALIWEVRYDGPGASLDQGKSVTVDGNDNVVVTGRSRSGSSTIERYVAKYAAATGAVLWQVRHAGPGDFYADGVAVKCDSSGNVIVTGEEDTATDCSIYTAKYAAADGAVIWEQRYNQAGGCDYAVGLVLDAVGNVAVAGNTYNGTNYGFYTATYPAQ